MFPSLGAGCAEPGVALGGRIRGNQEFPAGSQCSHHPRDEPHSGSTGLGSSKASAPRNQLLSFLQGPFYHSRHIWGAPRALQHPQGRICIPTWALFWLVNLFLWGVCVRLPQEREGSFQMGIWTPYAWKMLAMAQEKWSSSSADLPCDRFISRTHFWGVMSRTLKAWAAIRELGWN